MPGRKRSAIARWRRRPLYAGLGLAILAGIALWAYAPPLPPELLIARYANRHSQLIELGGGLRAHLRDEGNPAGVPVVLVHGSLGSLHVWEGWTQELAARARLISMDLPGHGLTGPWPRDEYTVEAYADFLETLVDALNLNRFVLAGHSLGGAVAWTFASTRPDRVTQLVLIDSAGYPRSVDDVPLSTRLARMPAVGDIAIHFKPMPLARRALRQAYGDPNLATPERVRRFSELQRYPGNRAASLLAVRSQPPLDPAPLRRLDVPTLIMWGAADRWVPVADAFRFQNDIKGAKLEIFEKLGHYPMEEDPARTAAAMAAFLAPLPPRPVPSEPGTDPTVHPATEPEKD